MPKAYKIFFDWNDLGNHLSSLKLGQVIVFADNENEVKKVMQREIKKNIYSSPIMEGKSNDFKEKCFKTVGKIKIGDIDMKPY